MKVLQTHLPGVGVAAVCVAAAHYALPSEVKGRDWKLVKVAYCDLAGVVELAQRVAGWRIFAVVVAESVVECKQSGTFDGSI